MTISIKEYAFAEFPRGVLPANVTRRQFFQGLVSDLRVGRAEQTEQPVYRLADLGVMPDGPLAQVTPVPLTGSQVITREGYVWGSTPGAGEPLRLFPVNIPAYAALGLFDGEHTILEVGSVLAGQYSWKKHFAFDYTRGVFLWLVLAKLFVPKGPKQE
jgi:hypothetical protein